MSNDGVADLEYLPTILFGDREKNTFYEESSRVPLMFRFPNKIAPNTVIETPVSLLDVFSTILDYAVGDSADSSDGKSLRRFIEKDREQLSKESLASRGRHCGCRMGLSSAER